MDNSAQMLTNEELNIVLELANLIGGTSSATLSMLLDQEIEFGKPQIVEISDIQELQNTGIPAKSVMAVLDFVNGLDSPLCFILDIKASVVIADIMMGGEPGGFSGDDISDIQLSAIGEAISQMMGASANSISQFLSHPVDISAPNIALFSIDNLTSLVPEMMQGSLTVIKYKIMGSKAIPDCTLFQVTPSKNTRNQVNFIQSINITTPAATSTSPVSVSNISNVMEDTAISQSNKQKENASQEEMVLAGVGSSNKQVFEESMPAGFSSPTSHAASNPAAAGGGQASVRQTSSHQPVTVQPVEFPSFDNHISASGIMNKNLELVMDVCLNLTVELGRTELSIKDVLELTRGSVIELNRIAGEPVDLFANGKMIAKGEVVVIEDNFGLRITSIVSPADRLRGL